MLFRLFFCLILLPLAALADTEYRIYEQLEINGHPGYLTAAAVHGPLDKVIVVVPGFDTENDELPLDNLQGDYSSLVQQLGDQGWDVISFEYADGTIDLRDNAENLADFLRYLTPMMEPDSHLALIGGSMGGIVARTLFVQENGTLGVDTFVSVDAPHRGVVLSNWVNQDLLDLVLNYHAARQMTTGQPDFETHYSWLQQAERSRQFKRDILWPINTAAIALSDGSKARGYWSINPADELLHNRWYPVASYVSYSGLSSTYMPYHSTAFLISDATKKKQRNGINRYRYKKNKSKYFDRIIPNDRAEHGAPAYTLQQAIDYILEVAADP